MRYTFLFMKQFASKVFVETAKGYFGAHRGIRCKRKDPQMKTRKKLSEKMISDVWIHLTELNIRFMEHSVTSVLGEAQKWYFGSHWSLWWQRKHSQITIERIFLRKFFVMCEFISQSYTNVFMEQFGSTVLGESEKGYFGWHWNLWLLRKYP